MDQLDKIDKEGKEKENKNWHTIRSENKTNFELNFLLKLHIKSIKNLILLSLFLLSTFLLK